MANENNMANHGGVRIFAGRAVHRTDRRRLDQSPTNQRVEQSLHHLVFSQGLPVSAIASDALPRRNARGGFILTNLPWRIDTPNPIHIDWKDL
jgi:hypothetical protein